MGLFDDEVARPRPALRRKASPERARKEAALAKARQQAKQNEQEVRAQKRAELDRLKLEISMLDRQAAATESRASLLKYTLFTMPDPEDPNDVERSAYDPAEFHRLVAVELEKVVRGEPPYDEHPYLIFCMPPRHGKTEIATKRLSAWYSGLYPTHNIAVGSYSDTMAEDMGGDVRAIVTSAQHKQVFPEYALRRGGNAKANIQTVQGGRLVFVGRGGAMTGRGAHLLLLDDVFKDHEEARSQVIRDEAWNWFTKVAMTRRMGKKIVIITMTRWHSDDIIGRLTDPNNPNYSEKVAKRWKIIRLPALAEEDDPLGREPGKALWPERYDEAYLEEAMELDELGYASLFQQRPTVADGILFRREHFKYYQPEQLPRDLRYYCASDHAVSVKQRNDLTCLLKVGVDIYQNIYLINCFWQRARSDFVVETMLDMSQGETAPLLWWAEKGHISQAIGPFLFKRMHERSVYINLREVTPSQDKEKRAQSIASRNATGKVFFPAGQLWTAKAVDQCLAFPNGLNDDFVDAFAYIGLGLQSQFGASKPKAKVEPPKFGTLGWAKYHDSWAREQAAADNVGRFT